MIGATVIGGSHTGCERSASWNLLTNPQRTLVETLPPLSLALGVAARVAIWLSTSHHHHHHDFSSLPCLDAVWGVGVHKIEGGVVILFRLQPF